MSSTNRGSVRHDYDHYVTPEYCIKDAVHKMYDIEPDFKYILEHGEILDPCCGGYINANILPPYVKVLHELGSENIRWKDIREDSAAEVVEDFLNTKNMPVTPYDVIISNPPFDLAREFIEKSFELVGIGGYVIFLLRLNFLGSVKRKTFFEECPPKIVLVHAKRPRFIKGKSGDSCEYAHIVWQKGFNGTSTLHII